MHLYCRTSLNVWPSAWPWVLAKSVEEEKMAQVMSSVARNFVLGTDTFLGAGAT